MLPKRADLYYGGRWHVPLSGRYAQTIDPALDEPIVAVADAGAQDAEAAIRAAQEGFEIWRNVKPVERAAALRQAAAVIRSQAEELAMLDAIDTGNPVAEMVSDARMAAAEIEYFAGLVTEIKGHTIPMGNAMLNYTIREPLGVVARIVAYNHPLMFAAMKLAAPLAAGNAVIVKAPEQAPLSSLKMAELVGDLFPPGVLNVLAGGLECGQMLASHPAVRKVTLIGSVATGKAVMRTAAETLKQVLLELGGKNAMIVYPDADIDKVVAAAVRGMNFTWAGQSCGSTSRLFLHDSIHDRVLAAVVQLVREKHCPGIPTDWTTTMGPLVSRAQRDRVLDFVRSALDEGATLMTGGKPPEDAKLARGYFVEPTVFSEVKPTMRIARDEIFGPVLSVLRWSDEDALFGAVNGVEYGLTASIWTRDLATAHRAAREVEAGYVWINNVGAHFLGAPFGGVKQSGVGREESFDELLEFTQIKNVNVNLGD
ncbi:MAG: NAD/NADP-dependent betaine aldehyde dehydrogenase [Alphaproteobacteria bacterium]|nr:MAG: NAD/NADP-dependent betaine aldehyde dehydrogenase [Alphaproteobacteria bacterium]